MTCAGAFGLGVDDPNVKFILYDQSPFKVNAYVQELGRGESVTLIGECTLHYNSSDMSLINHTKNPQNHAN